MHINEKAHKDLVSILKIKNIDTIIQKLEKLLLKSFSVTYENSHRTHYIVGLIIFFKCEMYLKNNNPNALINFIEETANKHIENIKMPTLKNSSIQRLMGDFPYLNWSLSKAHLANSNQEQAIKYFLNFTKANKRKEFLYLDKNISEGFLDSTLNPLPNRECVIDHLIEVRNLREFNFIYEYEILFDEVFTSLLLELHIPEKGDFLFQYHLTNIDRLVRWNKAHIGFNCFCYLINSDKFQEATDLAKKIILNGYSMYWRFSLTQNVEREWTSLIHQSSHIKKISHSETYSDFINQYIETAIYNSTDYTNDHLALSSFHQSEYNGKKPIKCKFSGEKIHPGEEVLRFIRMYNRSSSVTEICKKSFFTKNFNTLKDDFVSFKSEFSKYFRLGCKNFNNPDIALIYNTLALDLKPLDTDEIAKAISYSKPNPTRFIWRKSYTKSDTQLAFEPYSSDEGKGDALNLIWLLFRTGYKEALLKSFKKLDSKSKDLVFAALICFDDDEAKNFALEHFNIPNLKEAIDLVFKKSLNLKEHAKIANFGKEHPVFRKALKAAMDRFAIHLYSNYHPETDWFLEGLTQFSLGKSCKLLYFFILCPEEEEILNTVLNNQWLPQGVGSGAYDAYSNMRPFYYRAASLNIAITKPNLIEKWLKNEWMHQFQDLAPHYKKTLKLVEQLTS